MITINKHDNFEIYTDGSSRSGKKGGTPSGSAFILVMDNDFVAYQYSEYIDMGTAQLAEVIAFRRCLEFLSKVSSEEGGRIPIVCDSMYVVKGFNKWMYNWNKNNWRKSDGKEASHVDHWKSIYGLIDNINIRIPVSHVNSHSGNKWNDYVDELARGAWQNKK